MRLLLVILFFSLALSSFSQKKPFVYYRSGINVPAPDERNLDFSNTLFLKDKRNGTIVFRYDSAYAPYFDFFNDRYIIVKQVPLTSPLLHSATTLLVPMMNAVVIDMDDPGNLFVFKGNTADFAGSVMYYKVKRKFLILYTKDRKLRFKRKQYAGSVADW